jgi:hypothetical protein
MPPFLVGLIVVAVGALAYKGNKVVAGIPTVVPTTPATTPPGITTSFAQPPIQNYPPPPSQSPNAAPPVQTNQPSPSSSGVPAWSSNAQEFNTSPYMAAPSPSTRIPGFYAGPISANLQPRWKRVKPPEIKQPKSSSCGSGCGGGCQNASDCAVASARNNDGGCLAPTEGALLRSANPGVLASWYANVASAGATPFQAQQQNQFDVQQGNPQGDDYTVPASPFLQGIGINNMRPIRSAIGG